MVKKVVPLATKESKNDIDIGLGHKQNQWSSCSECVAVNRQVFANTLVKAALYSDNISVFLSSYTSSLLCPYLSPSCLNWLTPHVTSSCWVQSLHNVLTALLLRYTHHTVSETHTATGWFQSQYFITLFSATAQWNSKCQDLAHFRSFQPHEKKPVFHNVITDLWLSQPPARGAISLNSCTCSDFQILSRNFGWKSVLSFISYRWGWEKKLSICENYFNVTFSLETGFLLKLTLPPETERNQTQLDHFWLFYYFAYS